MIVACAITLHRTRTPCLPSPSTTSPSCPASPSPDPVLARQRPVAADHRPGGFEGEGFPVRRAFAGVALDDLDPFIHLDQMGEVEYAPGRAEGHALAPASRLRDRHLHDRRRSSSTATPTAAAGVITNGDTQWMTAGARHPAHREAAGAARRERRPVPRLPAVGQPAGAPRSWRRPATRTSAPPRSRSCRPPTAARSSASSPVRSPATRGPGPTYTPDDPRPRHAQPGRRLVRSVARRLQRPRLRPRRPGTVGASDARSQIGQLAVFGPGDALTFAADQRPGDPAPPIDVLILGGRPIREPVALDGPVRHEHPRGAHPGVQRLPGRPPRDDPGRPQRPDHAPDQRAGTRVAG